MRNVAVITGNPEIVRTGRMAKVVMFPRNGGWTVSLFANGKEQVRFGNWDMADAKSAWQIASHEARKDWKLN